MAEKNRKGPRRAIDGLGNFNRNHRICTRVQSQKRMDNFASDETEKQQNFFSEARGSGLNRRPSGHRENFFRESRLVRKSEETAKCETSKPSATMICGRTSVRSFMPKSTTGKHVVTRWPFKTSTKASTASTRTWKHTKGMRRVAPTAYAFFVKAYFYEFRKKNPNEKIHFITLSRRCAEKWHSLPDSVKQVFYKMAERASNSFNRRKVVVARKPSRVHFPFYMSNKPPTNSTRSCSKTSKVSKTTISKRPNKFARANSQQNATTTCNKRRTKKKPRPLLRPTKFRHNPIQSSGRRN